MSRQREVIGQAGFYSAAMVLTQLVTAIAALLTRRFLGPVQVGLWSLVQLVLIYSEYAALGTTAAIEREIPFQIGRGDIQKANEIRDTVLTFTWVSAAVYSFLISFAAYIIWTAGKIENEAFFALLLTALLVMFQRWNTLLISLGRAKKEFKLMGKQAFYSALVNAFLVATLSYFFKLYGFMLAMGFSLAFNIFYLSKRLDSGFKFQWSTSKIKTLARYGIPVLALGYLTTGLETVDRLMISKFLGLKELGLYSIASMAATYVFSFPNAVGVVMMPNIHEHFGETGSMESMRSFLRKADTLFCGIMPMFIAFAWFTAPPMILWALPNFAGGIPALKMLILGSFFLSLSQSYAHLIFVVKMHARLIPIVAVACLLAFVLNLWAIQAGSGIAGVAMATSFSMFVYFSAIFVYAQTHLKSGPEAFQRYFYALGCFAGMVCLLFVIERLVRLDNLALEALARLSLFFLCWSPLLFQLNRRFELWDILKKKLFMKRVPV